MVEFFNMTAGAASSIGLIVTLEAWRSGHRTHRLICQVPGDTQQPLTAVDACAHEVASRGHAAIKPDQLA